MDDCRLILGDALAVLPTLEAGSVDTVITDPPYPCIDRPYGRWTEAEWFALMDTVVPECRRVLKPTGSAVFILQPNSERVGRMRTWLWDFLAKWGREWGVVQDAYWWNFTALPCGEGVKQRRGLLRASVKACVWLGAPDCYRDQASVLWESNQRAEVQAKLWRGRVDRHMHRNNGATAAKPNNVATLKATCVERGGSTPFNVIPCQGADRWQSGAALNHPAATPLALCRWWVRYLCPSGGLVLDPFSGSGTVPLAAFRQGRRSVGIERDPGYHATAVRRLAEARGPLFAEVV